MRLQMGRTVAIQKTRAITGREGEERALRQVHVEVGRKGITLIVIEVEEAVVLGCTEVGQTAGDAPASLCKLVRVVQGEVRIRGKLGRAQRRVPALDPG